jgi:hypothetical protein
VSTLTTGDIGARLGVSADTVRRQWPEWHRRRGFPEPLPLTGSSRAILRWDAEAFETWRRAPTIAAAELAKLADIESIDWAAVARARGLALDAGRDPDLSA